MKALDIGKYYKNIIDHVPGAVIVFGVEDGMLRVRYVSDRCIDISGFTPEETYARCAASPLADAHPDDRKLFQDGAWDNAQDSVSFTYRITCKNGRYKWVQLDLSKALEDGEVLYYGLFSDVDEQHTLALLQKEKDQAVSQMQQEFQNMYDSILDETKSMITIIDAETHKVVYANKTAIQAAQAQEGYIGCTCYQGIHHAEGPCQDCLLHKPDAKAQVTEVTYAGRTYRMLKKLFTWNGRRALLEYSDDVTEQHRIKEVERELTSDREKEKILLDSIPGGVALYHIMDDGTIRASYISEGLAGMLGYTSGEFLERYGKDTKECVVAEDRPIVGAAIKDMLETHTPISNHYRLYAKSGDIITISFDGNAVDLGKKLPGEIATLYAVQSRVSDAHQKELEEDEIRQRLINYVPCGIGIYDLYQGTATLQYLNDAYLAMMELQKEDRERYYSHDISGVIHPEDRGVLTDMIKQIYQGLRLANVLFRIKSGSGKWKWVNLVMTVVPGEDDHYTGYASLFDFDQVISDQQMLEDARKKVLEEQESLTLLLNSVPAGIGMFTMDHGVLNQEYMNDAFFALLGDTREGRKRFSGKNSMDAIHPDDVQEVRESIGALMQGASMTNVDYRLINASGGYTWFHVTASVAERRSNYIRFFIAFFDCTESKEQELALLQNERAVELAQTQGDLAIWTYNIDKGVIVQQTPSAESGHMGHQVGTERVPDVFISTNSVHPDDVDAFLGAYRALADGEESVDVTYRLRDNQTGKYAWLRMFYQRMENTVDSDRMAVGFSMNVDKQQEAIERYQAEQALRKQMNANVALYVEYNLTQDRYESAGSLRDDFEEESWEGVSDAGYLAELSQSVEDAYAADIAEKLYSKNLLKAFAAGETRAVVEYRSKERPGMPSTWYRTSASLAKRPDTGDVMAFICVEDIEQEKDRRLAMESSLSDGIESIAIIQVSDGRTRLIRDDYGPAEKVMYDEYFTYDDDFVWRSHKAVVAADSELSYQSALLSTILRQLEEMDVYQYSIGTTSRAGVFKRQLFRFRYLDDRKTNIVLSVSDITSIYQEEQVKQRQLEQALAETKEAINAKADFYSRMSHDMRTPMNGILGMTALSEHEQDVAVLHDNLAKIGESGEYLLSLINDTLDIQRIESGKFKLEPQIVFTESAVAGIMEMMRPAAEAKGVSLQFDKGNADISWYVRIDPVRIKQIFINLLSNAIKFTPAGGTVRLASKVLGRDGMISHDVFTVSDTGIGMSAEFINDGIFQPFSQESNKITANYAGSGLGLSIVKSLVEIMGGRIEVESELGVGTTFTMHLDLLRVSKEEAERELEQEHAQAKDVTAVLAGKKILLVEDHPLNAEIAQKMLGMAGCVVTWVDNGQKAVEVIKGSQVHDFNAVLMDIRMPVMDGLEAARQIRALGKPLIDKLPIIAMTANTYEDDIKESIEAGMNAHLGKPIEPQSLYETLAANLWLGGEADEG